MLDTVRMEYEEEDIDLDSLLEGSCSQLEDSTMDLDSILRPLSDSQQAQEANLELMDEKIRNQIATEEEERMARQDQSEIMKKHKKIPRLIKRRAPGLSVFQPEPLSTFSFSDLSLETDFGWAGRKRLVESGLAPAFVDMLVDGKDKLMMVRYLAPETGQNNIVANKDDFKSMADYVFYLCTVCEDDIMFSVLSKCLFDLLKSCGYPWHVTTTHLLGALLNLGAREELLCSQHFYDLNLGSNSPPPPGFYVNRRSRRIKGMVPKPFSHKSRMFMLKNTVQLVADLLRMPSRTMLNTDTISMLSMAYLAVTCGLDQDVVDSPTITQPVSLLVNTIVSALSSSHECVKLIQDLVQMLSAGFLPGLPTVCPASTTTWSYSSLPQYMATAGHNHPHNMLVTCLLLPAQSSARQLICYVFTQLVMGETNVDLPDVVSISDLVNMLDSHKMLWKTMARDHHYLMWAVLQFIDLMVEGSTDELKFGSDQYYSMKKLILLLEHYLAKANMNDPLNLDPVIVGESAGEMASRWKLAVHRASNIHSMRVQTGQVIGEDKDE